MRAGIGTRPNARPACALLVASKPLKSTFPLPTIHSARLKSTGLVAGSASPPHIEADFWGRQRNPGPLG